MTRIINDPNDSDDDIIIDQCLKTVKAVRMVDLGSIMYVYIFDTNVLMHFLCIVPMETKYFLYNKHKTAIDLLI